MTGAGRSMSKEIHARGCWQVIHTCGCWQGACYLSGAPLYRTPEGPPDMAAGFPQNEASKKNREQAESHSMFHDLAFEGIHGHFHYDSMG